MNHKHGGGRVSPTPPRRRLSVSWEIARAQWDVVPVSDGCTRLRPRLPLSGGRPDDGWWRRFTKVV